MKKVLLSVLMGASMFAATHASAATYQIVNDAANNSPLHNQGLIITSWNATLTANQSGNSKLYGTVVASDHKTYSINVTLMDTYFANGNQYWGNFKGTLSGNGRRLSLNDLSPTRDGMDAVLGINAAPYNNGLAGGDQSVMEFGFWGDDSPKAGGNRNSDVNVHVVCTSGKGPANANGTCASGTPVGPKGGSVPLPGTLALMGLALLGLSAVRRKA